MASRRLQKRNSSVCGMPKFKVVLLGEAGVGKSSLFLRMKDGMFGDGLQPTVGIESCTKHVTVDGDNIALQVWDTAGVERYRTLTRNYYRNTHATLLVYSVTSPDTLHYLYKWIQDTHDAAPNALKFLIGNKADLGRTIADDSIQDFAAAHDCHSAFFVSAKSGDGLEETLSKIGEQLLDDHKTPALMDSLFDDGITLNLHTNSKRHDPGCGC